MKPSRVVIAASGLPAIRAFVIQHKAAREEQHYPQGLKDAWLEFGGEMAKELAQEGGWAVGNGGSLTFGKVLVSTLAASRNHLDH